MSLNFNYTNTIHFKPLDLGSWGILEKPASSDHITEFFLKRQVGSSFQSGQRILFFFFFC